MTSDFGDQPWARQWDRAAGELHWARPYTELYRAEGPYGHWFAGGRINLSANCLDRHLPERADQAAMLWEGEPGERRALNYRELWREVVDFAAALRGLGVGPDDRVALYLGWLPETVVAMLACARIGAVYTVLSTPLPAEALAERLEEFGPRLLVTQDGAWRHGAILPLKARADEALTAVGGIERTVVVRRTGIDVAWYEGDVWWHDLVARAREEAGEPEEAPGLDSQAPLLAVPLANRRGRPVWVVHGTATLLVAASAVHRHGLSAGGVFWCAGDITWLGAQAHGVFGPLAHGDTAVMFEGTLDVPTRERTWEMVERYGVATLVTSPSVVRRLRGWAHRPPRPEAVATLRRIVTLGEAIEPELRTWLSDNVGTGEVSVGDAWGQVELGGVVRVDRPTEPDRLPQAGPTIVDDDNRPVPDGQAGELVLRFPWAGTLRALEGSGAEDARRHWHRPGSYATGDRARRHGSDSLEFLGRIDAVVSISGQLVSLSEVRDVLRAHPFVLDAEVVERTDARLGRSLAAAVVLEEQITGDAALARDLLDAVREVIGGLARPRALAFVDRFGPELTGRDRRSALAALLAGAGEEPLALSWDQIRSSAAP